MCHFLNSCSCYWTLLLLLNLSVCIELQKRKVNTCHRTIKNCWLLFGCVKIVEFNFSPHVFLVMYQETRQFWISYVSERNWKRAFRLEFKMAPQHVSHLIHSFHKSSNHEHEVSNTMPFTHFSLFSIIHSPYQSKFHQRHRHIHSLHRLQLRLRKRTQKHRDKVNIEIL